MIRGRVIFQKPQIRYMPYKWLVAEIPRGTDMLTLPINSAEMSYTVVHVTERANLEHFTTNGYIYFTESPNMTLFRIWDIINGASVFNVDLGSSTMDIVSTADSLTVNGYSIPQYGYPIINKRIFSASNSGNTVITKTSAITVDGIMRYTPVRLLAPIPPSLDANGIRREKDECGFLDSVSGLFFGNVGSGAFTVSDN